MKKTNNAVHLEGYLYQHKLELKTTGETSKNPGTPYISGTVDIATNDDLTNIVTVHYTYVTEKTSKGNTNATYTTLANIINKTLFTVMEHGKDVASKVRVDTAVGLNEFYSNRTGEYELVSTRRNEGGFIHADQLLSEKQALWNTFDCDMLIEKVTEVEADLENNRPHMAKISGYIFDFRDAILPVTFVTTIEGAINYFLNLEASEKDPVFTRVKGSQINQTVVTRKEETSAWGDVNVIETPHTTREFMINWALAEPYLWDDASTMTAAELQEKKQARALYLEELRSRQMTAQANRTQTAAPSTFANNVTANGFNF